MILITGATGNSGRELVRQLVAAGQRVRALVRNPAKAADLKGPNVELAVGDFDHPATLDAALRGVDKAFLLTPVAEHFVEWQSAFIEAAQRAQVRHLVKFSAMGADSNAKVELLRLHGETTTYCEIQACRSRSCNRIPFIKTFFPPPILLRRRELSIGRLRTQRKARATSATSMPLPRESLPVLAKKEKPISSPGRKL